jgi:hypothetical protein
MDRLPTRGRHNRIARVAAVDLAGDAVRCGAVTRFTRPADACKP